ncbi:MAG: hypothetical protein HN368_18400 [Spirochaetales bacterium]|jgi:hypothetical protein|nr:hypothetical protein [Spirochaetales bacterium]
MKRTLMLLLIAGVAFLFLGCMELFTANLFSSVDTPITPAAADLDDMEDAALIATIENLVQSDSFYDDLAADETGELKTAVIDNLTAIYEAYEAASAEEQTPAAQQQALDAAVLIAEVELNSTQAGEVVDNFVTVATTFIDTPPDVSTPDGVDSLVQTVLGDVFADVTDSDSFNATISALLEAADSYTFFGENLDTDTTTPELDIPADSSAGAVAQDAVVALLVFEVLTNSGGTLTQAELEDVVINDAPFPADFAVTGNPLEDNTALANVLDASGLGGLFEGGATL